MQALELHLKVCFLCEYYFEMNAFREIILNCKTTPYMADRERSSLPSGIADFNNKTKQRSKAAKKEKRFTMKSAYNLYKGSKVIANAFKTGNLRNRDLKLIPQTDALKITNSTCTSKTR